MRNALPAITSVFSAKMPPQTSAQKAAVANFVAVTSASERTAQKYLKLAGYKMNEAVDAYFQGNGGGGAASGAARETALNKLFDSLRNETEDAKDTLGADTAMKYLQSIGAELDDASLFVAMELLQAPAIGEVPRSGFVTGWKNTGVPNIDKLDAQKAHFQDVVASLKTDDSTFRKIYRHTFVAGKESDQRALSLENSLVYWEILFKDPGQEWVGKASGIDWLHEWTSFLKENWSRSVNKDMWNQTLEFAFKSRDDESLSFWNEDGAWPGVIDDFVEWWRKKSAMDVDV
ncbi:DUF298-domain-containing protein [Xylariaceae sp. FL0016]|nr:DUF298-domain-containing protein [Xylariaceae sp. FL0016]